ncbi:LysR family transcriptional regulator [Vibrio sp. B183]|uniref:LysR family transcriptional regulator n=1 Tax=Vibrio sp. B183 TaxID=1526762 RepID=UPI002E0FF9AA
MNYMAKTDLNLIVIFDAIMREQSITIAAEQLAMTQPSVSKAVSRMRYACLSNMGEESRPLLTQGSSGKKSRSLSIRSAIPFLHLSSIR